MRLEVIWSPEAVSDLEGIIEYLQNENPTVAAQMAEKILSACDKLENFPQRGRYVPEMDAMLQQNIREIALSPWRVVYEILDAHVHILMVVDGRRDMQSLLVNLSLRTNN